MTNTEGIYQRSEKFISSDLGEAMILTNIDSDKFYGTNVVGLHIWDLLQDPISFNSIVEALLKVFKVEKSKCESEVQSFMSELSNAGAVQEMDK